MISQHEEVSKLVKRLQNSFAILENEKDPALLRKELAEHGALLKELEAKTRGREERDVLQGNGGGGKQGGDACCRRGRSRPSRRASSVSRVPRPFVGRVNRAFGRR